MKTSEHRITDSGASRFRMARSLKNPAYRRYLPGSLFQFACLSMQIITGPLLMYRLTESRTLLGTMALISAFPMILVSLFGGVIADRIQKKRIIIIGLIGLAIFIKNWLYFSITIKIDNMVFRMQQSLMLVLPVKIYE